MSTTLPNAREAFLATMHRDLSGSDRPRYTAVLDAMIRWSLDHPKLLEFRTSATRPDVISFSRTGSRTVVWSAQATRGAGPRFEFLPGTTRDVTEDEKRALRDAINAHSRETLEEQDRLRIGFGAMKNEATRTALCTMLESLIVEN